MALKLGERTVRTPLDSTDSIASDSIGSKRTLLPSYEVGSMNIQICRNVEMLNAAFFYTENTHNPDPSAGNAVCR